MNNKNRQKAMAVILLAGSLLAGQDLPAGEGEGVRLKYKAGDGLKIGDGNNLLHLQGRVQGRFTWNGLESAVDTDTFTIQRGKIKIEGHTLEKRLKFGFQMNLATRNRATAVNVCTNTGCTTTAAAVTAESTTGLATLEDFYADYVAYDFLGIKVGQFKIPFLMQELTSSGKQQFVDRALSTGFFNLGRDLGVNLHGNFLENGANYSLFVMNGDGVNTINRNKNLMFGTRIEVPLIGEYKPSESDTGNSEGHHLGFGVAYAFNKAVAAIQQTIAAASKASHGTLDFGYKHKGFSGQGAGMITRSHEGAGLTNWGYNAQFGWFFIPKKWEVAVKHNGTILSGGTANQFEHSAGLNYFIAGHGIKLQTDYALLMNNRGQGLNDHRVRTQMQVIF